MGQEISQQNKCNIVRRQQQQQTQLPTQHKNLLKHSQLPTCNDKYTKHNQESHLIYASSIISTASSASTDDEHYQLRQKYNLNKQTYEKSKIIKKHSLISNATTASNSTTSGYQSTLVTSHRSSDSAYNNRSSTYDIDRGLLRPQHERKNSQSTDSGIYYSSCHCASVISSSAASTSSIGSTSVCDCARSVASSSNKSRKSLDKQKNYLCRHLYIKSYLDILEEDEKARAHFQPARPGGIRNYKPKILAETTLSTSAPLTGALSAKQRDKSKDDPWI